jgi:hypothetical protein
MALIVEDGTGLPNADSYVSVADCDTYLENRGYTTWATLLNAEKENCLRRATDYLVQMYRLRWKGTRAQANQSLDWPRNFVEREDYTYPTLNGSIFIGGYFYYPSNVVPEEVVNACCELAFRAGRGELAPDIGRLKRRSKVDVLEVEYEPYSKPYTQYRAIDGALAPLLKGAGNSSMVRLDRV